MQSETVSPLSPTANQSCGPAARLSGIFGYFCFPDKSGSPISLRSKRGETAFSGFCAAKPCLSIRTKFANLQLWVAPHLSEVFTQTGPGHHEGNSGVSVKPRCQSFLRTIRELCRVSEVVNLQLWVTPHVSEVFTQTGPGHHEGNNGVSVKPHCQSVLRPSRVFAGIFGYFCFPDKSDSPKELAKQAGRNSI